MTGASYLGDRRQPGFTSTSIQRQFDAQCPNPAYQTVLRRSESVGELASPDEVYGELPQLDVPLGREAFE